ncbi:MAG TPA: hypothetical protein VFF66_10380 [Brevundimonas sp.]|nr:hypothetical protein [Brevundimonas sp.]
MIRKFLAGASICAASVMLTGAAAPVAEWWVAGAPVSGNPVGCAFYNETAIPLRLTTYRFHVPGRTPYVFVCNTNCVVAPGQQRIMVSPIPNSANFVFTCDGLVRDY